MASPLSDLDELVLKCRDEKAKSYIKEAVSCYKSGAFRSAIVSTWIAVSFDIIDKIRELSLAGDKEADAQLTAFEKARDEGNISHSLKFEREILEVCRDKLELISHLEFIDLARLQEDRNRCAHPSMTSDSQIFNPSAELARVHIRSAVEYLLQYPPAQGKSAMAILLKEIDSEYFPVTKPGALVVLKNSPLIKARQSLVTSFMTVLLKEILLSNLEHKRHLKLRAALSSIEELYKDLYDLTLKEKLSNLFRKVEDTELSNTFNVLLYLSDSWAFLDLDLQQKIKGFVRNLESISDMTLLLNHNELRESAIYRLKKSKMSEIYSANFFVLPEEIGCVVVNYYAKSTSFEESNYISTIIQRHSSDFTKIQVQKIIESYGENRQVYGSHTAIGVLDSLRQNASVSNEEFKLWLNDAESKH